MAATLLLGLHFDCFGEIQGPRGLIADFDGLPVLRVSGEPSGL